MFFKVKHCDNFQQKKVNRKYGKLLAKLDNKIP